jgi:hypothetical protein
MSVFAMGVSFAANSEKIDETKGSHIITYKNKVVNINEVFVWNRDKYTDNHYYNISIKEPYNKKYKIQSVNVKYVVHNMETGTLKNVNKKYSTKKNNTITFKHPNSYTYIYYIEKITVNYKTKTTTKSESSILSNTLSNKWKNTQHFHGTKSKIVLTGQGNGSPRQGYYETTNQKLKVQTKNTKHKIKSVECLAVVSHSVSGNGNYVGNYAYTTLEKKTFKGNGKNTMTIKLDGKIIDYNQIAIHYY